jgi:hypothetical protein
MGDMTKVKGIIGSRAGLCPWMLFLVGFGCIVIFAQPAAASFVGFYDISNFVTSNGNADGSFSSPDAGLTAVLTGGNNGSGLEGATTAVITAGADGLVQFSYLFETLDVAECGATFDMPCDTAGYLLKGQLTSLTQMQGTVSFAVLAGDEFGFRVDTVDNQGEPGILTVSEFSAPTGVPEPGFSVVTGLVLVALGCYSLRRGK